MENKRKRPTFEKRCCAENKITNDAGGAIQKYAFEDIRHTRSASTIFFSAIQKNGVEIVVAHDAFAVFFVAEVRFGKEATTLSHAIEKCAGDECFSTCVFRCVGARALGGDARSCNVARFTIR